MSELVMQDPDMKGRWRHAADSPFGPDFTTYEMAMAWLDGHGLIEDWGCGTTVAKRFVKASRYRGVDGSAGFADVIADLRTYTSDAPCILMRHVLDHNRDWRHVLENAVASFRKRMVLVLFVPFADGETHEVNLSEQSQWWDAGIVDMAFNKADLLAYIGDFVVREDTLFTNTGYGWEHVFYLEKP